LKPTFGLNINDTVVCVLCRFAKVGNSDPTDVGCPIPDAVLANKRSPNKSCTSVARSVSVSHAQQQSSQQVRGQRSWRLGILSSVVTDNGPTNSGRSVISGVQNNLHLLPCPMIMFLKRTMLSHKQRKVELTEEYFHI